MKCTIWTKVLSHTSESLNSSVFHPIATGVFKHLAMQSAFVKEKVVLTEFECGTVPLLRLVNL